MISRADWDRAWLPTVISLVVFTPLVVLRIRQGWRHRSSIPVVASGVGATVLYLAWLSGLQQVWQLLPPGVRGVQDAVVWDVLIAACLQVFMVGVSGGIGPERLRRRVGVLVVVAAVVLTVVLVLSVRVPRCVDADMYVCSSMPIPHNQVPVVLIAAGYIVVVLAHCVWLGCGRANRTPSGVGMGLLAAGAVAYLIAVVHAGFYRTLTPVGRVESFTSSWAAEGVAAASGTALVVAGFVYPPVVIRLVAWRRLRALAPLWNAAVVVYPGLAPPGHARSSLPDRLAGRVAYLQDALTLTAQHRGTPLRGDAPLLLLAEHAAAVARWFAGEDISQLNCGWLAPPEGVSTEDWLLVIAGAYQRLGAMGARGDR